MILSVQTVISNITVALIVGALAWMIGGRGRYTALAHVLWVTFFIKLVTPPVLWLRIGVPAGWAPAAIDLPPFVLVIWAAGSSCVVLAGLVRLIRFHRLVQREGQRDPHSEAFVAHLLRQARQTAPSHFHARGSAGQWFVRFPFRFSGGSVPRVVRLPTRVSPMLFGFGRRPTIICPDSLWQALGDDERQALLAHETAHFFRRDHWVRWLEWLVTAAYWWFPGVYIARRELERHEEAACDAWAVHHLRSAPRRYAETLLRVIDFLNESPPAIPRLCSGMHPTGMLEQRLRMLMRPAAPGKRAAATQWSASLACVFLWTIHPSLYPLPERRISEASQPVGIFAMEDQVAAAKSPADEAVAAVPLPEPPRGFWNERCLRRWANFSLSLPGVRLRAETNQGITIERPDAPTLRFGRGELSAIAEVPSTHRVIIGDASGRVRLWDLQAGTPVSLVGRHAAEVTSLTYRPSYGIVSGDSAGSVVRWDLQSGLVLATWSTADGSVQSVRAAPDGEVIAVLIGSWREPHAPHHVCFVDPTSLDTQDTVVVSPNTAVVIHDEWNGWLAVEWSGAVRRLDTGEPIGAIAKHDVSALALSEQAEFTWSTWLPRMIPPQVLEAL